MNFFYILTAAVVCYIGSTTSCKNGKSVYSQGSTYAVTSINSSMNYYCESCKRIDIPENYTWNTTLGSTYKFYADLKKWNDARKACSAEGAHLAIPDSLEEVKFFHQIRGNNGQTWLGFHKVFGTEVWNLQHPNCTTVLDQTESFDGLWAPRQPSANGKECGGLSSDGLHNINCTKLLNYICEINC